MTQTIEQILEIVKLEAEKTVDCDLLGNPITDADVLLMGAYGPLVIRIVNAAIESYKAELLKEVGEPVASTVSEGIAWTEYGLELPNNIKLFTSDQLLAARKPLEEEIERLKDSQFKRLEKEAEKRMEIRTQLATAEQRVAEACAVLSWHCFAEVCNTKGLNPHHHGEWLKSAKAIRAGEWRKFVKEGE